MGGRHEDLSVHDVSMFCAAWVVRTTVVVDGKLHAGAVWLECLPRSVSNHHAMRDTHWSRVIVELVVMERNPAAHWAHCSSRFYHITNLSTFILVFNHKSKGKPQSLMPAVSRCQYDPAYVGQLHNLPDPIHFTRTRFIWMKLFKVWDRVSEFLQRYFWKST